jgi:predicted PhzF superfamily epimerase YddE/YHI9
MGLPFFVIDSFTNEAFHGNPAAVCLLDGKQQVDSRWMQLVAAEINLSETAFLDLKTRQLRWFTPIVEVDLCGHATLATVKAMQEASLAEKGEVLSFKTRSGELTAQLLDDHQIQLDFPATPCLGIDPAGIPQNCIPSDSVFVTKSTFDLMFELPTEEAVRDFQPIFDQLRDLPFRGVIITAISKSQDYDFVSRFFGPSVGVNEDPVTGSAHCMLGPYWSTKLGKKKMHAAQLSNRGGEVGVEISKDRVILTGEAVTVIQGQVL